MTEENPTFIARGTEIPLPKGADAFRQLTNDIFAANKESASMVSAILLYLASFCMLISPVILAIALPADQFSHFDDMSGIIFFATFFGFVVLSIAALRKFLLANINSIVKIVKPYAEELLASDEEILAICHTKKTGASMWLTGISKSCIVVFTTHRILLLSFKSVFKSIKKALMSPGDNISILVCDAGTKGKLKVGGMMFPPMLHLLAKRITILPEESEREQSMAAFIRFGHNGSVIKTIISKLEATGDGK